MDGTPKKDMGSTVSVCSKIMQWRVFSEKIILTPSHIFSVHKTP